MSVVIETTVGDLTVDLFLEERPTACLNFIKLCKLKYYNYNLFHTIEQDFIAQTGDPTGAGDGGSSVWGVIEGPQKRFFEAESLPKILHNSIGLLSLVSPAKNLVGSQFFFTLGADLTSLDGQHCVIGEVVEGHETLRCLNEAIVDEKCRPYQDIRITHTVILEDPFPDMRGFRAPSRSPSPRPQLLQNGRIAADEDIDDTDGKTMEEIQEMLAEREAKARATILEIVGDLPDAECAPPENVLFVCKLNPVTTEDDLEIIFSRFGKVKSCEVIRDRKSGDSLQYAFVEFDEEKSCEAAYFKMNNVLIDDRRIHVDFSQSVARVKWRGKGRGVEHHGPLDFNNVREAKGQKDYEKGGITVEERRKAREKRHREQNVERNKEREGNSARRKEDSPTRHGRRDYRSSRDKLDNYRTNRTRHNDPHNNRRRADSPHERKRNNDDSSRQRRRDYSPAQQRRRREETSRNTRNDSPHRERKTHDNRNYGRSRSHEKRKNYSQQRQQHKSPDRPRCDYSKTRVEKASAEANYDLKGTQKRMDLRNVKTKQHKKVDTESSNASSSSSNSSTSSKSSSSEGEEEERKKKKQ